MHVKAMVYGPTSKDELDTLLLNYTYGYGIRVAEQLETLEEALCVDNPRATLPVMIVTESYLEEEGWGDLIPSRLIVEGDDETYTVFDRHTPHVHFKEPVFDNADFILDFGPLSLKVPNEFLPNPYTARLSDIDWQDMIADELTSLEDAISDGLLDMEQAYALAEIRAYCGYVVILPGEHGYEQILTNTTLILADEEFERLKEVVARIKALPNDTQVHLVGVDV